MASFFIQRSRMGRIPATSRQMYQTSVKADRISSAQNQGTLTALDSMECTQAVSLESATRITLAPTASRRPQNVPRGSTTQTSRASAFGHETLAGMTVTQQLQRSQSGRRKKGAPQFRRRSLTENQLRNWQMDSSVQEARLESIPPCLILMTAASTMSASMDSTPLMLDALPAKFSIQLFSSATCLPMLMDVRTITILRQRQRRQS